MKNSLPFLELPEIKIECTSNLKRESGIDGMKERQVEKEIVGGGKMKEKLKKVEPGGCGGS